MGNNIHGPMEQIYSRRMPTVREHYNDTTPPLNENISRPTRPYSRAGQIMAQTQSAPHIFARPSVRETNNLYPNRVSQMTQAVRSMPTLPNMTGQTVEFVMPESNPYISDQLRSRTPEVNHNQSHYYTNNRDPRMPLETSDYPTTHAEIQRQFSRRLSTPAQHIGHERLDLPWMTDHELGRTLAENNSQIPLPQTMQASHPGFQPYEEELTHAQHWQRNGVKRSNTISSISQAQQFPSTFQGDHQRRQMFGQDSAHHVTPELGPEYEQHLNQGMS
jgi:hypothetical protein